MLKCINKIIVLVEYKNAFEDNGFPIKHKCKLIRAETGSLRFLVNV